MNTIWQIIPLVLLIQGIPEPRIDRTEDLRRQSEDARLKREAEQRKLLQARDEFFFQENAAKFMPLAKETCSVTGAIASKEARKRVSENAKQMDSLITKILFYLDSGQKPSKLDIGTDPSTVLDRLCGEARLVGPKLDQLVESSKKKSREATIAAATGTQLANMRAMLKILK